VSNTRSGQVQCLPPCCVRVSQSLGAHATFVLLLPYACRWHRATTKHRVVSKLQPTLSRRGHSRPKPSSHCIVARDMTRPTTIFSTLLTSSKLSPSATGVTQGVLRGSRHKWMSRRRSFRRKRSRRKRSACGRRCRSSRSSTISAPCVPFLSHYFIPLPASSLSS